MNPMFLGAATALIGATLLLLLRPWQRRRVAVASPASASQLYRAQMAELEQDRACGQIAQSDFEAACRDLQRRLLQDQEQEQGQPGRALATAEGLGRVTLLALLIGLPLGAAGLYRWLGMPEALDPAALQAGNHEVGADQIQQMVETLAQRLASSKEPNPKGWAMLGRSYHAMGRMGDAAKAFENVGDALHLDPVLLSDYADVLAAQAGGQIAGRPLALVEEALKLDPDYPMALSLAATAAWQQQDAATATRHWQHLLQLLPPDSEDARWVQEQLSKLHPETAQAQTRPAPEQKLASPADAPAITGRVTLAPSLAGQLKPEATLFVFARAASGSHMPLAILRAKAGQLPLDFRLDDSLSMSPAAKLSGAQEVVVEARISASGDARPAPGDLYGLSATIKPGATGLQLLIDKQR